MNLVTRAEWNAKKPSSPYTRLRSTKGVKIHYTGGKVPADLADAGNHDRCADLVRDIQRMHMAGGRGERYIDLGYNMVCCPPTGRSSSGAARTTCRPPTAPASTRATTRCSRCSAAPA
ncbi:hypothetical protein [Nonomuraea salmonea]|uniref:hypothetical protein n=1 Tax=Nonomuraea salmonea TaxID=46181 RepID=UPI002FE8378E